MNRRNILIIIIGLAFLLIFVAFLWPKQKNKLFLSEAFAANIQFPYVKDNKINYFTGFGFGQYSLDENKTKSLTPIYALPNVTDVKWGDEAVLFKASGYSAVDQLEPILSSRNLSLVDDYWWLADFKSGSLSLAGSFDAAPLITDVMWVNESNQYIYLQVRDEESEADNRDIYIAGYGAEPQKIGSSKTATSLLWANKSSIFALAKQNDKYALEQIQLPGLSSKVLLNNVSSYTSISADGKYVSYNKPSGGKSSEDGETVDEYAYNIAKDTERLVAKGSSSEAVWTTGYSAVSVGNNKDKNIILATSVNDSKATQFYIENKDLVPRLTALLSGPKSDRFLIIDHDNLAYLASGNKSEISKLPKVSTTFLKNEKTVYQNAFYIAYSPNLNQYEVYITKNPFSGSAKEALAYMVASGADPNQLFIKWYADDGINPGL